MFSLNWFSLFYDILAYIVAVRSLLDEIQYKLGFKRKLDVQKDLDIDLTGRVAIVTGGTRGLGLTVVRTLVTKGCFVFVASSQTSDKFQLIVDRIYNNIPEVDPLTGIKRGTVTLHYLDLSSMDSVIAFVNQFKKTNLSLSYLICNAGIMFAPRQVTRDFFESHLSINFLGHCLLILELLPILKSTADKNNNISRIISVSSSTHRITRFRFEDLLCEYNYSSSQAYAQSKLAQIMFTTKLSRYVNDTLKCKNVLCYSLHPGVVLSELYEHVNLIKYFPFLIPVIKLVTRDMDQGAETILYAALSNEIIHNSGGYLEDCDFKEPSIYSKKHEEQDRLWEVTTKLLTKWHNSDKKLD